MSEMDPQVLAEECAKAMFARDRASQKLGMNIESVAPGKAVLTMTVTCDMIQGHGSCHGGYLFTLADSAFAFACNSYDRATVASGCSIDYMYGAKEGDRLTATAEEQDEWPACRRHRAVHPAWIRNANRARSNAVAEVCSAHWPGRRATSGWR